VIRDGVYFGFDCVYMWLSLVGFLWFCCVLVFSAFFVLVSEGEFYRGDFIV
jgi:hypothetical protein